MFDILVIFIAFQIMQYTAYLYSSKRNTTKSHVSNKFPCFVPINNNQDFIDISANIVEISFRYDGFVFNYYINGIKLSFHTEIGTLVSYFLNLQHLKIYKPCVPNKTINTDIPLLLYIILTKLKIRNIQLQSLTIENEIDALITDILVQFSNYDKLITGTSTTFPFDTLQPLHDKRLLNHCELHHICYDIID